MNILVWKCNWSISWKVRTYLVFDSERWEAGGLRCVYCRYWQEKRRSFPLKHWKIYNL